MAEGASLYYLVIESALRELGIEPNDCRGEVGGSWNIAFGDLMIQLDVWELEEQPGKIIYQVQSPIMMVPEKNRLQLFEEVLIINNMLFGVAFSLVDQSLYIKSVKEAKDLKHQDVVNSIHFCGHYAEQYQKHLLEKYGGQAL